ncbi:hypothetical protein [Candidatus Bathycorpusculum sp.]
MLTVFFAFLDPDGFGGGAVFGYGVFGGAAGFAGSAGSAFYA